MERLTAPGSASSTGCWAVAWCGLARAHRRRARNRQVHGHQRRAREPLGRRPEGPVRLRRGVRGPGEAARRAAWATALACRSSPRPISTPYSRPSDRAAGRVRRGLRAGALTPPDRCAGSVSQVGRCGPADAAAGARDRSPACRPRDEGGLAPVRAACSRAPRGLRPLVRGRARAPTDAARAEEPLRLDQRGRGVRDARAGARRGRGRLRPLRRTRLPRSGLGRAVRDGGVAAAARRGAGARRAERAGAAATRRQRRRPQPARAGARRAGPPRGRHARVGRRIRLRGRRRARDEPGADLAIALALRRPPRALPPPPTSHWPPSASSASPASSGTWATRTAASPRRASSGSSDVVHPPRSYPHSGRLSAGRGARGGARRPLTGRGVMAPKRLHICDTDKRQ